MGPEDAMIQAEAISRLSFELSKLYEEKLGKKPKPEVVQAEAEAMVSKYGPKATIREIFDN